MARSAQGGPYKCFANYTSQLRRDHRRPHRIGGRAELLYRPTGAGKSLVIGAIEVLLGLRSAAEMLRPGVDEGRVSGVFDVSSKEMLARSSRQRISPSPTTAANC